MLVTRENLPATWDQWASGAESGTDTQILHLLWNPVSHDTMYCQGPPDPYHYRGPHSTTECPYVNGTWANYQILTYEDVFGPGLPTTHTTWART